jgi:hypothetical protein
MRRILCACWSALCPSLPERSGPERSLDPRERQSPLGPRRRHGYLMSNQTLGPMAARTRQSSPSRRDCCSAQYLVDADENGKCDVGLDPVDEITGLPELVYRPREKCSVAALSRSSGVPRAGHCTIFRSTRNGQAARAGSKRARFSFWRRETAGPWTMVLSVDLDNVGTAPEGVLGVSTRFAVPIRLISAVAVESRKARKRTRITRKGFSFRAFRGSFPCLP